MNLRAGGYSLVIEHLSCYYKAIGLIPKAGKIPLGSVFLVLEKEKKNIAQKLAPSSCSLKGRYC